MNRELQNLYQKETGKRAWQSWGPPDCVNEEDPQGYLEVDVEAPSVDYIKWLEKRASDQSGSEKTPTNTDRLAIALMEEIVEAVSINKKGYSDKYKYNRICAIIKRWVKATSTVS